MMIIYEETNVLVSCAFLKWFSIHCKTLKFYWLYCKKTTTKKCNVNCASKPLKTHLTRADDLHKQCCDRSNVKCVAVLSAGIPVLSIKCCENDDSYSHICWSPLIHALTFCTLVEAYNLFSNNIDVSKGDYNSRLVYCRVKRSRIPQQTSN